MYIVQDLNEKQVAVLQAIADTCFGCRLCRVAKITETIANSTRFRCIEDITSEELDQYINQLEAEYLVERKDHKGQPHVGLTDDGRRCNRIDVIL